MTCTEVLDLAAEWWIGWAHSHAGRSLMPKKQPKTVPELYAAHEALAEQAKALYNQKDETLKKLVRAWRKNKTARVTDTQLLEIEDTWRGKMKAFAPAFSHRYKLTLKTAPESK